MSFNSIRIMGSPLMSRWGYPASVIGCVSVTVVGYISIAVALLLHSILRFSGIVRDKSDIQLCSWSCNVAYSHLSFCLQVHPESRVWNTDRQINLTMMTMPATMTAVMNDRVMTTTDSMDKEKQWQWQIWDETMTRQWQTRWYISQLLNAFIFT